VGCSPPYVLRPMIIYGYMAADATPGSEPKAFDDMLGQGFGDRRMIARVA
jgi:hypothetical protein